MTETHPCGCESLDSAVSPTGYLLKRGMEVTLGKIPGRAGGRYEITAIEREASGKILLTVYGPLRRGCQRYHFINPSAVAVTHVKTRANRS